MKHINIAPNTLVPKRTRISVYKQAIKLIESGKRKYGCSYGLCLILPCILWDLKNYCDNAPNGNDWHYNVTLIMFPEIKSEIHKIYRLTTTESKNKMRKNILKDIVKKLTKKPNDRKTVRKK